MGALHRIQKIEIYFVYEYVSYSYNLLPTLYSIKPINSVKKFSSKLVSQKHQSVDAEGHRRSVKMHYSENSDKLVGF